MEGRIKYKQYKVVLWDDTRYVSPKELKISLITVIPDKSQLFCMILDLSFVLRLSTGELLNSVNNTTEKIVPHGATNQMGHALMRLIHLVFAKADTGKLEAMIFVAKWDTKDGFW